MMDNRTHHHLGFNLFVNGEAGTREKRFIVAGSDTQNMLENQDRKMASPM